MAYASETLSLATLELLVHLPSPLLPKDLVAVEIHAPDDVTLEEWPAASLPPDWSAIGAPDAARSVGVEWLRSGRTLLARVPSAVVPREWNVLINPVHPELGRLRILPSQPFGFDPRLARSRH